MAVQKTTTRNNFFSARLSPVFGLPSLPLLSCSLTHFIGASATFAPRQDGEKLGPPIQTLQPWKASPYAAWKHQLLPGMRITSPFFANSFQKPLHSWQAVLPYGLAGSRVGNHLNTRVSLVAFQLCIWDGCNQVGNKSVDKTDLRWQGGHHMHLP